MLSQLEIANRSISASSALAACAVFVTVAWIVVTVLNSPLRSVPGTFLSRWTSLWIKIHAVRAHRPQYVNELHQKYGPLIRLSPNEVSTTDPVAVKAIYKVGSPFLKSRFYTDLTGLISMKEHSVFVMQDPKEHAHHRRLQGFNFSEKWLKALEPGMIRNVKMAAAGMKKESESNGHFDSYKWLTFMATDVLGDAAFGESFKLLESGKKNQYIEDLETVGWKGVLASEFPFLVNKVLSRLPFGYIAEAGRSQRRIGMYGAQSIDRYQKQWKQDKENVKPTLLTNEYKLVEDGVLTQRQIIRDATGDIVAGTDTTAVTATYLFWELANHPEIQAQIIEAVQQIPEDCTDDNLKHIELFQRVINETLRLWGPASSALPRVVPAGGITICDKYIPAGTVISTQAYSLHRDPEIWEDVLIFKPSRWENLSKEQKDAFMPFGGGSRVCIGMHFGQMELRHAIVNFYKTFPRGVAPAENFSHDEMIPNIYFLAQPRGRRCLLQPL